MKSGEKNVEKILDRAVTRHGNLPEAEVDAAMDRAWEKLRPQMDGATVWTTAPTQASRRIRAAVPLAAAAAVLVALLSVVIVRNGADTTYAVVEASDDQLYVSAAGTRLVHAGARIDAGEIVRSTGKGSAVLSLQDGSKVEMRAQSELALERTHDGVRIRLSKGGVIVSAATQALDRHLYVQTKDVEASVGGAVSLVKSEEEGSRVAAIGGEEVRVQQGDTEKNLKPGEQVTTNPRMSSWSVKEEIAWSQRAGDHLALWEQAAAPTPSVPPRAAGPKEAFEVATVKPVSEGPRAARGDIQYPCNGAGPQIDPVRFAVGYISLFRLLSWANGLDCGTAERFNLISGGPAWMRTSPFAIQATLPAGSPGYTVQQFLRGDAPKLQQMLQTLIAERFKVATHRESKEMPAYNLVKVRDTGRLKRSEDQTAPDLTPFPIPPAPRGVLLFSTDGTGLTKVSANAVSIAALLDQLRPMFDRPVSDKTDLTGLYDIPPFQFTVATPPTPIPLPQGTRYGIGAPQISEILEQLGLKLESAKASMEVQVIDHAERPSDN